MEINEDPNTSSDVPSKPTISIRDLTPADFPDLADISVDAQRNSELFGFACPYRYRYPISYRIRLLKGVKDKYYDSGRRGFVAEEVSGTGQKKILGWAAWRTSPGDEDFLKDIDDNGAKQERWTVFEKCQRAVDVYLMSWESAYKKFFGLDRSVSPAALRRIYEILDRDMISEDGESFPPKTPHLYLSNLLVDPAYQRRGIGTALLGWGFHIARRENIAITVESSKAGMLMYQKLGFRTVVVDQIPHLDTVSPTTDGTETQGRQEGNIAVTQWRMVWYPGANHRD